jgi:hypothetical protein
MALRALLSAPSLRRRLASALPAAAGRAAPPRRSLSASTGTSSPVPTPAAPAAASAEVVPFDVAEARRVAVLSEARDDAHVEEALRRKVTVFKQGQHAMTSGTGGAGWWGLKVAHEAKWANGLMGWVSSADTQRQPTINLRFDTAEQAVLYCERNGLEYEVLEPADHPRGVRAAPRPRRRSRSRKRREGRRPRSSAQSVRASARDRRRGGEGGEGESAQTRSALDHRARPTRTPARLFVLRRRRPCSISISTTSCRSSCRRA